VQAQGVVCPTLFSPGQRAYNETYSISSWIMRPRGMACSHHHFEPITSSLANKGAEIFGIDIGKPDSIENVEPWKGGYPGVKYDDSGNVTYRSTHGGKDYTSPYYYINSNDSDYSTSISPKYLIIQMSIHSGHKISFKATSVASDYMETGLWNPDKGEYDYIPGKEIVYDQDYGANGWGKINNELITHFKNNKFDP
jgi:hypothetical protein